MLRFNPPSDNTTCWIHSFGRTNNRNFIVVAYHNRPEATPTFRIAYATAVDLGPREVNREFVYVEVNDVPSAHSYPYLNQRRRLWS